MQPTKPSLFYPIRPISINQPFGANVEYYESHFGQKGHPGIDLAASHGEPVYAAHDGQAYAIKDAHGGEGIWIYAGDYITIYWHLIGDTDAKYPPVIPFDHIRHPVKRGDLIGYADNTGAPYESDGDHLHFGLMLAINDVPTNTDNGTQGCVDPQPYFNDIFANNTQEVAGEVLTVATDVAKIDPSDTKTPQEESLIEEVIEKIGEELKQL